MTSFRPISNLHLWNQKITLKKLETLQVYRLPWEIKPTIKAK